MGYETKMYIVRRYSLFTDEKIDTGMELASIELSKCGDDAVGTLIANSIKKANESEKTFGLWTRTGDRQQEAVEFIRREAKEEEYSDKAHSDWLKELSNQIEDGTITRDKYGDKLPTIDPDEMIAALEADLKDDNYRRFRWALNLLKAIREDYKDTASGELKVVTYGH